MKARDVMVKDVIKVGPDTTIGEIAAILVRHRISGVPVVGEGDRVIGIVTQTDLAHRSETGTEKRRKWWLEIFADPNAQAREYVKSHGLKARDVMTRVVISVSSDADLAEVADILDTHRIRQAPVMDGGKIVGMISRADLVRALAQVKVAAQTTRSDSGALQKAIREQMNAQPWLKSAFVNFMVRDGVVELWGAVDSEDQRRALRVLVEGVPGVQKVEDNVGLFPKVAGV
ncbi:MAG: CBS domain-containing protein [Hyphomicrobiaceae bacterium]|nr:MAG: CBS domain-containing protein [Hyphomicrobiaceae bacterium]